MNKPEKIRVMIVDDSSVVRLVLGKALSEDQEIHMVGSAKNGKIAVEKIPELKPDVIILDIEMPELDGFGVLRAIQKDLATIRVVMFSTLSERGASKTLEALSLGASDYLLKPTSATDIQDVSAEVIQKIKQFFPGINRQQPQPETVQSPTLQKPASTRADLIVIGTSTGGPMALSQVIPKITPSCKSPILIVQHMPPVFTEQLAKQLNTNSALSVEEAKEGMDILSGHVYIAPGDYHMTVKQNNTGWKIGLNQDMPENYCRPSVDVTFRSLAEQFPGHILAIVMTGMGKDGLNGARLLRERKARIFAQDEDSCVVYGMPSYIVEEGLADEILSLNEIPQRINELCLKE